MRLSYQMDSPVYVIISKRSTIRMIHNENSDGSRGLGVICRSFVSSGLRLTLEDGWKLTIDRVTIFPAKAVRR